MRTVNVFSYSELSDAAKSKAIESYKTNFVESGDLSYDFSEPRASLRMFSDDFDCRIRDCSFSIDDCQVDLSFHMDGDVLELSGIRAYKYLINNFSHLFWKRRVKTVDRETVVHGFKQVQRIVKYVSGVFVEETCCANTGVCWDEILLQPFREFLKKPDANTTIENLINAATEKFCADLMADLEYQESDENIADILECNDHYEFYENGAYFG